MGGKTIKKLSLLLKQYERKWWEGVGGWVASAFGAPSLYPAHCISDLFCSHSNLGRSGVQVSYT